MQPEIPHRTNIKLPCGSSPKSSSMIRLRPMSKSITYSLMQSEIDPTLYIHVSQNSVLQRYNTTGLIYRFGGTTFLMRKTEVNEDWDITDSEKGASTYTPDQR